MLLLQKTGFPPQGDLVLCTVTKIYHNSVFVTLDEYGKSGMIHISEISPGRIRNIRDYVTVNKKIVCKVLNIDMQKGHIDLSLRRVNDNQRKNKNNEVKQQQVSEKIIKYIALQTKQDPKKLCNDIYNKIKDKYTSTYSVFEEALTNEKVLDELGLPDKEKAFLLDKIKQRIQLKEVTIKQSIIMQSYAPDGVEIIKEILKKVQTKNSSILFNGGGKYTLAITAPNYKDAEKELEEKTEFIVENMKKQKANVELIKR